MYSQRKVSIAARTHTGSSGPHVGVRLRRLRRLPATVPSAKPVDREALLHAVTAADPRRSHVARTRNKDVYFSNGGTELQLARESAPRRLPSLDAVLALDTRALGAGRDARLLITCAIPIPLGAIARAGLGRDRVSAVQYDGKRVIATVERVYEKRVVSEREECPQGELCRAALVELLARGSLFRKAVETSRARLSRGGFERWLAAKLPTPGQVPPKRETTPALPVEPSLEAAHKAREPRRRKSGGRRTPLAE